MLVKGKFSEFLMSPSQFIDECSSLRHKLALRFNWIGHRGYFHTSLQDIFNESYREEEKWQGISLLDNIKK